MSQGELLKDFQKVRKTKMFFDDARVVASFDPKNVSDFRINVLPRHGFYRNMLVRFKIIFEDYPNKKPSPTCLTRVFHPNISSSGSICFSMYGHDFSADFRLMDYVNGLIFLLDKPNPDDPLNSQCVEHDEKKYDEYVQNGGKGYSIGSNTYEYCNIDHPVKDSKEFGVLLKPLLFFLDQKKVTDGLERKIEHIEDQILRLESTDHERYLKFMDCVEKIKFLFSKVTKFGEIENFGDFSSEDFEKAKMKCEKYFDSVSRVYTMDTHVDRFWDRLKRMKFSKEGRVFQSFQRAFQPLREAEVILMGLVGNFDEEKSCVEMSELIASMDKCLEKCSRLMDLERKIDVHEKRVLGSTELLSKEIIDLYFIPHDFKILEQETMKIYELLNMDVQCEKVMEAVKLVRDIRRNSKALLELEKTAHLHQKQVLEFQKGVVEAFIPSKTIKKEELIELERIKLELNELSHEIPRKTRRELSSLHEKVSQDKTIQDKTIQTIQVTLASITVKLEDLKNRFLTEKQILEKSREEREKAVRIRHKREARMEEQRKKKLEEMKKRKERLRKRMEMLRKRKQKMKKNKTKDTLAFLEKLYGD